MECLDQQQIITGKENKMRLKIVLKDIQGNSKDARITNMDETSVQFSDIKTTVVSHFPELEKKEYIIGWIDEERDFIAMGSDEELKTAMAATKGEMLKIHVKIKQKTENVARKVQMKEKVPFRRQYFANLLAARQKIGGPGSVVLHNQNIEGIRKVIRKHPGVLFVGGYWNEKMREITERRKQILKKKTQGPIKNIKKKGMIKACGRKTKCSQQKLEVNRIIRPPKAISLLQDQKRKNEEDGQMLSFLFVPIIAGRERQHCHVLGDWEESSKICVAFKRRGGGGRKEGNTGGKQKKMERRQIGNQARTPGNMKDGGEKCKKKQNPGSPQNICFVARKRMKMIAGGIFAKIDLGNTKADEKLPL